MESIDGIYLKFSKDFDFFEPDIVFDMLEEYVPIYTSARAWTASSQGELSMAWYQSKGTY